MHSAPFLNYLHTFQRRAMRKDRSIQNKYMNTGNSAILFSPDTCLVGYAKRQVKTSSVSDEQNKSCGCTKKKRVQFWIDLWHRIRSIQMSQDIIAESIRNRM